MSDELKPCPFCGSDDIKIEWYDDYIWAIGCENLDCSVNPHNHYAAKEAAIEAWNTRPEQEETLFQEFAGMIKVKKGNISTAVQFCNYLKQNNYKIIKPKVEE